MSNTKKNRFSPIHIFPHRHSWNANKLAPNSSPWKSFLSFQEAKSYTRRSFLFGNIRFIRLRCRPFRAIGKFMRIGFFARLDYCSNKIFFYRIKRFTGAIDVALDTRSLLFVRNKISFGNGKGEDGKVMEKKVYKFFRIWCTKGKWFAALKISIMDYLFYQRIIKAFGTIPT